MSRSLGTCSIQSRNVFINHQLPIWHTPTVAYIPQAWHTSRTLVTKATRNHLIINV
jgi:hypothetical protein